MPSNWQADHHKQSSIPSLSDPATAGAHTPEHKIIPYRLVLQEEPSAQDGLRVDVADAAGAVVASSLAAAATDRGRGDIKLLPLRCELVKYFDVDTDNSIRYWACFKRSASFMAPI